MSKITAPNYTQIPNVVLDEWIKILNYSEFKILMIICRKTFGWHKTKDKISYNQLSEMTGICKNTVISSLKKLEDYGLIKKTISKNKKGFNNTNTYEISIKDIPKDEKGVVQQMHHGSATNAPTKETLTKETLLKRTKKKKKPKQNTHCSSFQEIKKLMPEVSDGALNFWLKTWGYEVVLAAVKFTLSKKNVGNKAGYTRKVLNKNITDLSESDLQNKALAEEYAEVNKAIKVNKAYAVLNNNKEVYYKMSNQEFENILKNEFRGDEEIVSIEEMLGGAYVDYLSKQDDCQQTQAYTQSI